MYPGASSSLSFSQVGYLQAEILNVIGSSIDDDYQGNPEQRLRYRILDALNLCYPEFGGAKSIIKILSLIDNNKVTDELLKSVSQVVINDAGEVSDVYDINNVHEHFNPTHISA